MKHKIIALLTMIGILQVILFAQATSPIVSDNSNIRHRSPITLTARDANLSEILRVLAERSGMNFVTGEGVHREKITLILNKTPLDEAINLLVRAAGLSYEIIGNSVLIAEPDKLKEEVGLSSYVVDLKYAQAKEVAEMLKDLTKNIKIDHGGNRLICFTSPRVILEIERIVKSIDHPHILVLLEARLIEVSMDKLDEHGIKWSDLTKISSGITYPESPLNDGFKTKNWTKMPLQFNITLDMLLQNGDARMLMNSKLTTTNNREASLHIGEVIPYLVQSYNMGSSGGTGANMQVQKENTGVIITMTPHVNEENQITLNIAQEVSNLIGLEGEAQMPHLKTRKTNTTIRVEDGQKVFLAGLLQEDNSLVTHKVPVLGNIPLLGLLFQHSKNEIKKTNLIIEIIPRIIHDPKEIGKYVDEPVRTSVSKSTNTSSNKQVKTQTTPVSSKAAIQNANNSIAESNNAATSSQTTDVPAEQKTVEPKPSQQVEVKQSN